VTNGVTNRLARIRIKKSVLYLMNEIVMVNADETILEYTDLGDIGRYDGQPGGEVFADLERIGREC